jgi:hypothetical protein
MKRIFRPEILPIDRSCSRKVVLKLSALKYLLFVRYLMLKVFDFLTFRLFLDMQYLRNSKYFGAEIFRAILRLQDLSMGKISDLNYAI